MGNHTKNRGASALPNSDASQVAVFEPRKLPEVTKGVLMVKQGTTYTRQDGTSGVAQRSVITVPSVKVMKTLPQYAEHKDDDAWLEAERIRIGLENKPLAMARVSAAAAHGSFILKGYSEQTGKKSNLTKIGVVLEQVRLADKLSELMTASGKSEEECRKFLGMPPILKA